MHLRGGAGGLADDEVGLEAGAVDADPLGFDAGDDLLGGGGLGAGVLDVVVVVVELDGGRSGFGGRGEGDGEVGGADGVVPDVRAVGAVVVQGLVDNVPRVTAGVPVRDQVGDVVLHHGDEGGVGPRGGRVGEPVWQLVVPD